MVGDDIAGLQKAVEYIRKNTPNNLLLPTDASERKKIPLATGVLDYFPQALIEIAKVSYAGNQQHNPGMPLQWSRGKSADHADTLQRHFAERGKRDTDGMLHSAKGTGDIRFTLLGDTWKTTRRPLRVRRPTGRSQTLNAITLTKITSWTSSSNSRSILQTEIRRYHDLDSHCASRACV